MDVKGKVAVVTGAGGGIGFAVSKALLAAGAKGVAMADLQADLLQTRAAEIGGLAVPTDVTDEAAIQALVDKAEAELGPVKGLVTNAGTTGKITRVEAMTSAAMHDVMNLNVIGVMIACREAVKRMSTKNGGTGGAIVNLSSIAARIGAPGEFVHYAASKAAVDSWTWGLAQEVAAEGIRVNAVCPGAVDTHMLYSERGTSIEEVRSMNIGGIPEGRIPGGDEIAHMVSFLADDRSRHVNGANISVDGGYTAA